jgi:hypothetical protein
MHSVSSFYWVIDTSLSNICILLKPCSGQQLYVHSKRVQPTWRRIITYDYHFHFILSLQCWYSCVSPRISLSHSRTVAPSAAVRTALSQPAPRCDIRTTHQGCCNEALCSISLLRQRTCRRASWNLTNLLPRCCMVGGVFHVLPSGRLVYSRGMKVRPRTSWYICYGRRQSKQSQEVVRQESSAQAHTFAFCQENRSLDATSVRTF